MNRIIKKMMEEFDEELCGLTKETEKEFIIMHSILKAEAEYCAKKTEEFIKESIKKYKMSGEEKCFDMSYTFGAGNAKQILDGIISKYFKDVSTEIDGLDFIIFFRDWLDFENKYIKILGPYYWAMIITNGIFINNTFIDDIKVKFYIQNNFKDKLYMDVKLVEEFELTADEYDKAINHAESIYRNQDDFNNRMIRRHFKYNFQDGKEIKGIKDYRTKIKRYGGRNAEINIDMLCVFGDLLKIMPQCSKALSLLFLQKETRLPKIILGDRVYEADFHKDVCFSPILDCGNYINIINKIKNEILKDYNRCEELLDLITDKEFDEISEAIEGLIKPIELITEGNPKKSKYYRALLTKSYKEQVFNDIPLVYDNEYDNELLPHSEVLFSIKVLKGKEKEVVEKSLFDAYHYPNKPKNLEQIKESATIITKPNKNDVL